MSDNRFAIGHGVFIRICQRYCYGNYPIDPCTCASCTRQDGSIDTSDRVTVYGLYTLHVTDSNNCANLATVEVRNNCRADVFLPNAFTPIDHNGINDFFYPVTHNVRTIEFKVYNRWGDLLYETTRVNEGWDGSIMNKTATSDVYARTITYAAMKEE